MVSSGPEATAAASERSAMEAVRQKETEARAYASSLETLNKALATAKATGKRVFIDFETTWCGPCKTMDEWIWTDAEVSAALAKGFVTVKLDGDIEKALVKRFSVAGYPTMVIVDPASGKALKSVSGYQSSVQVLAFLR